MEGRRRLKIVVIGAGNVATHLALALDRVGEVCQIVARHADTAKSLAAKLAENRDAKNQPDFTTNSQAVIADADFYLISVSDDSVAEVAASLPNVRGIVAHTSGSVPMQVLDRFTSYGVFYPLQTFSRDREISIQGVPFFLEANTPETVDRLRELAEAIGGRTYDADSTARATLHLAAVFACNYANLMWDISSDVLARKGYAFDVFAPLMRETISKAAAVGPFAAQTGPAMRGDIDVINKHLSALDGTPKQIYQLLAETIMQRHGVKPHNNEQDTL
jgi:predicted short-subunit dehydrogenase-like oxidoreductase (DUF2520 family)